MIASIATAPGTYLLELLLQRSIRLTVGKLGRFKFQQGTYYYVGSAFGPGGLRARLNHHIKGGARLHWHIDYLRRKTALQGVWLSQDRDRHEHQWAAKISSLSQISTPVAGFGASDCTCPAHLFYLSKDSLFGDINKHLQKLSNHLEHHGLA